MQKLPQKISNVGHKWSIPLTVLCHNWNTIWSRGRPRQFCCIVCKCWSPMQQSKIKIKKKKKNCKLGHDLMNFDRPKYRWWVRTHMHLLWPTWPTDYKGACEISHLTSPLAPHRCDRCQILLCRRPGQAWGGSIYQVSHTWYIKTILA